MTDEITDDINDDELWDIFDRVSKEVRKDDENIDSVTDTSSIENICMECESDNIIFEQSSGSYICKDCGNMICHYIDKSPEWNTFDDNGTEATRCGAPTNIFLPQSSLGTKIGGKGATRIKMLQKWNQMPYKERSLYQVIKEIESRCEKYNIPKSVIDNAKILYKHVSNSKINRKGNDSDKSIIIRGINRQSIKGACVYYGAKLQKFPRSAKEVASIFEISLSQLTKGCRKFIEILRINPLNINLENSHMDDYIERYSIKLKLNKNHIEDAKKISRNIIKLDLATNHQPLSIAAVSMIIMIQFYKLNITRKSISDMFEISDVTTSKVYKKIEKYQQVLLDDKLVEDIVKIMKEQK
jgi:transcription initiation factor TFIIIB Brf1 subunit/transcription initiation factor TFIIB